MRLLRPRLYLLLFLLVVFLPQNNAAAAFNDRADGMAQITNVRVSSDDEKVRVVADGTKELKFLQSALTEPKRVVIDIVDAWLGEQVKREMIVGGAVKKIRVAQFDPSTVRMVIETDADKDHVHAFTLANPERLVIDFRGVSLPPADETPPPIKKPAEQKPAPKKTQPGEARIKTPPKHTGEKTVNTSDKTDKTKKAETADKTDKKPPTEDKKEKEDKKQTDKQEVADKKKKDGEPAAEDDELAAITGLKGKIVAIDPGHGGPDVGAIGSAGVTEKSVTLKISQELRRLLEKEGAKVVMTRTRDAAVSSKGAKATAIEELQARCDVANQKKANIFISVHMDAFTNEDAGGTTAYYYDKGSEKSKKLADCVREALIEQIKTPDRGTQSCNFYVVRNTDMPAILIEVAFISNPEEEKLLNSEEGVKKAAQGIADGIADYFG